MCENLNCVFIDEQSEADGFVEIPREDLAIDIDDNVS